MELLKAYRTVVSRKELPYGSLILNSQRQETIALGDRKHVEADAKGLTHHRKCNRVTSLEERKRAFRRMRKHGQDLGDHTW